MTSSPPLVLAACRKGKLLVIPRGAALPPNCVKCGAPAEKPWRKKFYWHPPLLALCLLLMTIGLLLYVILGFALRKTMDLNVPLCAVHHRERKKYLAIGTILFVLFVPMGMAAAYWLPIDSREAIGGFIGTAGFIGSLVFLILGTNYIRPKRIDNTHGEFTGTSEAFLQLLPPQADF